MSIAEIRMEKKALLTKHVKARTLYNKKKAKIDAFFTDEENMERSFEGASDWVIGPVLGRPKVADKKVLVTMRLTESALNKYKARTGRGWQTRLREYVEKGIASGLL